MGQLQVSNFFLTASFPIFIYRHTHHRNIRRIHCAGLSRKLVNRYLNDICKVQLKPWDKDDTIDISTIFTVVEMVKKDRTGANVLERVTLEGSVNEIFSANVNGKLPNRIVLIAPAGKGKTTAVAKIAYDWASSTA